MVVGFTLRMTLGGLSSSVMVRVWTVVAPWVALGTRGKAFWVQLLQSWSESGTYVSSQKIRQLAPIASRRFQIVSVSK